MRAAHARYFYSSLGRLFISAVSLPGLTDCRQEKETWIRAKYVEKKFLKKMAAAEALVSSERKSERRWAAKKCRRHNSATNVPKHRRKYRQDPGSGSLCSGNTSYLQSLIHIRQRHSFTFLLLLFYQPPALWRESSGEIRSSVLMNWTPFSPTLTPAQGLAVSIPAQTGKIILRQSVVLQSVLVILY